MEIVRLSQNYARYLSVDDLLFRLEDAKRVIKKSFGNQEEVSRYDIAYMKSKTATRLTHEAIKSLNEDVSTADQLRPRVNSTVYRKGLTLDWMERVFFYISMDVAGEDFTELSSEQVQLVGHLADRVALTHHGSRRRSPREPVYESHEIVLSLSLKCMLSVVKFDYATDLAAGEEVFSKSHLRIDMVSLIIERKAYHLLEKWCPVWMKFLRSVGGLVVVVD